MNRAIAPTALAILFAAVFVVGTVPKARADGHRGCTNASLQGSFGYTSTGTLLALPPPLAGPVAEVGRQTFDGNGNTDATATLSANGNIVQVTIQGTYVVNPDCTGSSTVNVSPFGITHHVDFVIDDDGTEVRAIFADPGLVQSSIYKKQFPQSRKE